jgi:hypothetical protein
MHHLFQIWSPSRPMFHAHIFDPPLIVVQIIALQSAYWFLYCVCVNILFIFSDLPLSTDRIFLHSELEFNSLSFHFASILSLFITSILSGYMMSVIVERSKKCLDFAATVHLFHFLAVFVYSSFPLPLWWILWGLSLLTMYFVGKYFCEMREFQTITLESSLVK